MSVLDEAESQSLPVLQWPLESELSFVSWWPRISEIVSYSEEAAWEFLPVQAGHPRAWLVADREGPMQPISVLCPDKPLK